MAPSFGAEIHQNGGRSVFVAVDKRMGSGVQLTSGLSRFRLLFLDEKISFNKRKQKNKVLEKYRSTKRRENFVDSLIHLLQVLYIVRIHTVMVITLKIWDI